MAVAPPLLARLTDLASLTQLLRGLGVEPLYHPLDSAVVGVPALEAALLGRRGTFEWMGIAGPDAVAQASRLSRHLATRGTSGVIALDPGARRLALAVGLERVVAIELDLDAAEPGHLERLQRLGQIDQVTGLGYALRAMEALDGQDVGRRFFAAFREQLDTMAEALSGNPTPAQRQTIALVQLTRILFLYFVQLRGWLDGRHDFLRRAVDDALARRRHLHRDLFKPLFFGTLNRQVDARGQARRFGRIPFLNGGLFEPHPVEQEWRGDIPNPIWRDAFDQLFERFHFCAAEGVTPGSIAPDMLGRVFEGLMAPTTRRSSGTFYTPERLVRRMIDAALATWLGSRLGCGRQDAERRLTERSPDAIAALRNITVLDPAAGSGAFLLGALHRLAELQAGDAAPAVLRRRILERNLFGVDESPMAVRLAELRLWLAVIAVERDQTPEEVAPLPNLDGVVRQGDSLLDPAWFLGGLGATGGESAARVGQLRRDFVRATGLEKREAQRRLRQGETRALRGCLSVARDRTEQAIVELLGSARTNTLFGERRGLDRQGRTRLRELRSRLSEIRRLDRRVRSEGALPWFVYASQFGDVLDAGGFDLVVGNPPWVRAEQIPVRTREQLGRRYRWWRGSGRGFAHQPDLAVAFVERGIELLAPQGTLGLLVPTKLATAGYAARLRAGLADQHTIEIVADLCDDPAAVFEATTYPAALVVSRRRPDPGHTVRLALDTPEIEPVPQARLLGGAPWILGAPALLETIASLRSVHPLLGERFTPQSGVKTGANSVFLDPPDSIEPALIRQALRGRDILPFQHRARLRFFFPHDRMGVVFPRLPCGALAHVRQHEAVLRVRIDYRDGPHWTLFRVRPALAAHRVVWADIARQLNATALTGIGSADLIPLNSCYLLAAPDQQSALALAAWLNSTWMRVMARATADPASNGFARFTARVIAELPLPLTVAPDARLAALAQSGARGEPVQEEIDAICAKHLGLTPEARALLLSAPGASPTHRGRSTGRGR